MRILTLILLHFMSVCALPQYPTLLPNGFRVPHPCFESATWKGVGHQSFGGGGVLNAFGIDFRKNGHVSNMDSPMVMFNSVRLFIY